LGSSPGGEGSRRQQEVTPKSGSPVFAQPLPALRNTAPTPRNAPLTERRGFLALRSFWARREPCRWRDPSRGGLGGGLRRRGGLAGGASSLPRWFPGWGGLRWSETPRGWQAVGETRGPPFAVSCSRAGHCSARTAARRGITVPGAGRLRGGWWAASPRRGMGEPGRGLADRRGSWWGLPGRRPFPRVPLRAEAEAGGQHLRVTFLISAGF